jgi:hypothetical protein
MTHVRMAERSKAPDSSANLPIRVKAFWSSIEGVGSNPTSDNYFFSNFILRTFRVTYLGTFFTWDFHFTLFFIETFNLKGGGFRTFRISD